MYTKTRFIPRLITALLAGTTLISACASAATEAHRPENTLIPATEEHNPYPSPTTPAEAKADSNTQLQSSPGTTITFGTLTLLVPPGIANGATGSDYPRIDSEDAAWWQKTPGHLQIMLDDYYVLQGQFQQPQIYVYPAQAYAEMVPPAFESLHRLNNILGSPGMSISADKLPAVPFINAEEIFASNIQEISFQNGKGVRFLTQYAQSPAPVNNHELFYHFQGVTGDGATYIIAILPVKSRVLVETRDTVQILPLEGVASPDITDPNADWQGYYATVTDLLNASPPDAFTPSINQLDLLIQSMRIAP